MPFEIEFTPEAIEDVRLLPKKERRIVLKGIEAQLRHRPLRETRNRKRLRPNQMAEWELRLGKFRVFFDVDPEGLRVKVEAVGYKTGSRLFIHGEEYEL
jgi:mRNA-degrading endonuclease RelE of RelBE toxin-antitoxin system